MQRINPGSGYSHYSGPDGASFDILPSALGVAVDFPFKVKFVRVSNAWHFKVVPGMVNSLVPTLGGTDLDAKPAPTQAVGSSLAYIYLKCQYYPGVAFPYNVTVEKAATIPVSDDSYGYISIARIDATGTSPKKLSQTVETSLWGERLKCGETPAEYFFARA